jgi:hypothetical protein
MATAITERVITESDLVIDNSTKAALSYYDKANEIIKRTYEAMGRSILIETTTIASTINGTTTPVNCIKTL